MFKYDIIMTFCFAFISMCACACACVCVLNIMTCGEKMKRLSNSTPTNGDFRWSDQRMLISKTNFIPYRYIILISRIYLQNLLYLFQYLVLNITFPTHIYNMFIMHAYVIRNINPRIFIRMTKLLYYFMLKQQFSLQAQE